MTITFDIAVAACMGFCLLLVFLSWIFYNFRKNEDVNYRIEYFHKCPFCTYVFFSYADDPVTACPRCRSLITHKEPDRENP